VDSVRASDRQRVAVLLGARDDGGQRALELVEQQPPGGLKLERECSVEDVRGGQAVMEPASKGAQLLPDCIDKRRDVVLRHSLDLR
jgi:hypothetical protein